MEKAKCKSQKHQPFFQVFNSVRKKNSSEYFFASYMAFFYTPGKWKRYPSYLNIPF